MPLGTRLLVAALVLLFGAGIVYYGFLMAPTERPTVASSSHEDEADAPIVPRFGESLAPAGEIPEEAPSSLRADIDRRVEQPRASDPLAVPRDREADRTAPPLARPEPQGPIIRPPRPIGRDEDRPHSPRPPRDTSAAPEPSVRESAQAPPSDRAPTGQAAGSAPGESSGDAEGTSGRTSPATPAPSAPREAAPRANEPLRVGEPARAAEAAAVREHVVREGETLSSIARAYYGSAAQWPRIARANPAVDPDRLRIGQRLRIEPVTDAGTTAALSGRAAPQPPAANRPARSGGAAIVHEVRSGETLSSISELHYGTPNEWRRIFEANRSIIGSDPGRLRVGQRLRIEPLPGGGR